MHMLQVVDVSPASGYYEARKPRLRNGGLNARLYNAFRVTTKDHLSINTRSPQLRSVRNSHSFMSVRTVDVIMFRIIFT